MVQRKRSSVMSSFWRVHLWLLETPPGGEGVVGLYLVGEAIWLKQIVPTSGLAGRCPRIWHGDKPALRLQSWEGVGAKKGGTGLAHQTFYFSRNFPLYSFSNPDSFPHLVGRRAGRGFQR